MCNFKYQSDKDTRNFVKEQILVNAREIYFPVSRFDPFDVYYLPKEKLDEKGNDLNNKMRFIELKTRNFEHNKYPTTILELDKYNKMTASTVNVDIPVELIVLFEDGYLYYSSKDVINMKEKESKKYCPDQYDAYGDKWCTKTKDVVELKITDKLFHPYEKSSTRNNQSENN